VVWVPRRGTTNPAVPVIRSGDKRLAGVAGAVVAAVVGLANVLPSPGGQTVVTAPAQSTDGLHGITANEPLPTVPAPDATSPAAPRQVYGPTPLTAPAAASTAPTQIVVPAGAYRGIPNVVLAAYRSAATELAKEQPSCHLPWELLAGIGHVESGQANNGAVDSTGRALTPIIGPRLDGSGGFALVPDTDHGVWDEDTVYDRAVGPMQFLPSTWRLVGRDGNGDGKADPENIYDASLATATYLCDGRGDLSTRAGLLGAVFRYNRSWQYVSLVLTWGGIYAGAFPTTVPSPTATPSPTTAPGPTATPSPTASTPPGTPVPTATPTPSASAPPAPQPTPTLAPPTDSPRPDPTAPVTAPSASPSPTAPASTTVPTQPPTDSPTTSPTESPTPTDSPATGAGTSASPSPTDPPTSTPAVQSAAGTPGPTL
jgi:membrane-bound lytic murein transglycosylase B